MPAAITYVDSLTVSGLTNLVGDTFLFGGTTTTNLLVVAALIDSSLGQTVSSVVFDAAPSGSLSLTYWATVPIGTTLRLELWYGFSSGNLETEYPAGTITFTLSAASLWFEWGYACFVGSIKPTPMGTAETAVVAADTTVSAAVAAKTGDLVVAAGAGGTGPPTTGVGQTDRGYAGGVYLNFISTKAGAALVTCSETAGVAQAMGIIVAAIQQAARRPTQGSPGAGMRVGRYGQPLKPLRQRRRRRKAA